MFYYAGPLIFQRAKQLRNHLTGSEMKLWGYLRSNPFGYKFRRQHPLGIFIVDFYCHALQLVIEVDGNVHDQQDVKQADIERQNLIEAEGIQVMRFSNNDIANHFEEVIVSLNAILQKKDTLTPLSGGRGV